jgi:hypothetical protein
VRSQKKQDLLLYRKGGMTRIPKPVERKFKNNVKISGFVLASVLLAGCGYYPRNQAAVAIPSENTLTFTGSVLPTKIRKKANEYDEIIRMESLTGATWKFESDKIFISPSLYYIGFGSGVGYIFDTGTVLSGFVGTSFFPASPASGLSISQAILKHYFIEYRLNYAKLHYEDCAFGCFESGEGEFNAYHTLNFATLFGMFYSEFNLEATSLKREYLSYGISAGVQIHMKSAAQ